MALAWAIVTFVLAAGGTLAVGLVLRWVDRFVTARVQWRVGPPFFQPFIDLLKLMGKENLVPAAGSPVMFLLAPPIALAATGVAAAVLWRAVFWPEATFLGDLIVAVYLLAVPAVMTIIGACASGSPHAALGAGREMKLLLSYELPMLLAILVAVAQCGWTFRLGGLIQAQAGAPVVMSLSGALALVIAILCMQAKLGQIPFDMAEAECEIMSGVYVEYSGPSLALILMTRAMLLALLPLLLIVVFWGGLHTGAWWGPLSFAGKYVLLVALVTLIRNTNPRLRIDQALRFFWFRLTPAAIVAVILVIAGASEGVAWL